jgi:hypothetical protein
MKLAQETKKVWQQTPTYAKIGVGVLSIYLLSKSIKSLSEVFKGGAFGKQYGKDIKDLESQNILPSYADQVYVGFADTIYSEYLNEFFPDLSDVMPIYRKMNNDADLIKLTQAYGERRQPFSLNKGGLATAITGMFDGQEIEAINELLRRKGIRFQY